MTNTTELRALMDATSAAIGVPVEPVVVCYGDRFEANAEDEMLVYTVPKDNTPWRGSPAEWELLLRDSIRRFDFR